MTTKIQDRFKVVGETTVDSKERVTLARALKQLRDRFGDRRIRFSIALNESTGVIVLTPATTVPLREAWLYENPEALKMVRTGIAQAGRGELIK
ncbi:MAG: hypothetical protein ACHQU1_06440, partial [Gemmatimonadales bacterium]